MAQKHQKKYRARSFVFNIVLFGMTFLYGLATLPVLFFSNRAFIHIVIIPWQHAIHFLERVILRLDYEVRGLEHLPEGGAYLIAAKHQSAYETLKLHLLFDTPAIILKKELLDIPLFGTYSRKSDLIAIDRSTPDSAIKSIQEGTKRAAAQGRAIVIFPQGTRVPPDVPSSEKRYKIGIVRIQESTGLPIIPLALNCGLFWPRKGWLKHPGKAVFEFLPPIPAGGERSETLKTLEKVLENASNALRDEELSRRGQ